MRPRALAVLATPWHGEAPGAGHRLDGRLVLVAGAHPDDAVDGRDPHLPVTDATGLRGLDHDPCDVLDVSVVHEDLDADLGHQRDVVLRTPVDLRVALLAAVAADLADGHAGDAEGLQRGADLFPLVRLDHRGHELHALTPLDSDVDCASADGVPGAPPESETKSYAVSPCSEKSMPSTSSSSSMRQPIVYLMASPISV